MKFSLRAALTLILGAFLVNGLVLGFLLSPYDYNHLAGYYEIAWRFWSHNLDLPHFNPLLCGGRTLGADPQVPIFHPLIFLVPLIGAVWLLKLEMLFQLALGAFGLEKLLRHFGASKEGRLWGLFLFLAGGGVIAKFMAGHVTLGFYFLLPLIFYLSYQLDDINQFTLPRFSAYLLLFAYCGLYKPNFLIYLVPALGAEILARSWLKRSFRPVGYFSAAVVFMALFNAVSYLPAQDYFKTFPRFDPYAAKQILPHVFLLNLLLPLKAIPNLWYGPFFLQRHEYNQFIGPVAVFFSALGVRKLWRTFRSETLSLLVFIFISIWLGCGTPDAHFHLTWSFSWLETFWPGFDSIRVPTRFWFGAGFGCLLFSGLGFRLPKRRWGSALVIVFGILPVLIAGTVNLSKMSFPVPQAQWDVPAYDTSDFSWVIGTEDAPYSALRAGQGTLQCLYNLEVHRAPQLQKGPLLAPLSGATHLRKAKWHGWNRIRLVAQGKPDDEIVLNFNHSPYWRFDGKGARVASILGAPLSLALTDSDAQGELVFTQPKVEIGFLISLAALVSWLTLFAWGTRKRRHLPAIAKRYHLVGLTGGVGAGKSQVAELLLKHKIAVIDLDRIGRDIAGIHRELIPQIQALFDEPVIHNGKLNRARVAEIIFQDKIKREKLEALLHPLIWQAFLSEAEKRANEGAKLVVCEAALLVGSGLTPNFSELIVVTAPESERITRLQTRPKMDRALAQKIIAAQLPEAELARHATRVIVNDQSLDHLNTQVEQQILDWKRKGLV